MALYQVLIFVIYICYQIEHSDTINEAQVELFRQSCPYTNFCSSNSSSVLGQTDRTPCCMDCFCDSVCFNYGDCCPDLMVAEHNSDNVQPVCKEVMYQNDFSQTDTFSADRPMYRVIDECPSEYKDTEMTIEKCAENYTGPTTYDDIVMVSADDFRLFQNKHCARCHHVKQTTRWNLQVVKCKDDLEDVNFAASEMQGYIMKNCLLWSTRPATVPLNGRTMDCRLRSTCSDTVDENVKEACVNGPVMPFNFDGPFRKAWFRNVMCFECEFGNMVDIINECLKTDNDGSIHSVEAEVCERLSLSDYLCVCTSRKCNLVNISGCHCGKPCGAECSYKLLQNIRLEKLAHSVHDGCRRMYCPPLSVAQYGRCVHISKQILNLYVGLNIVFTPEDSDLVISHRVIHNYNPRIEHFYLDRIRKKVNLEKCHISTYSVEIARKPSSDRVEFLNVGLNIYIDDNCSLEYLGNHIRSVQAGIRQTWLINNDTVPMKGRYYFGLLGDQDSYRKDIILHYTDNFGLTSLIDRFFVCPYFSLSVSEYNERISFSNEESTKLPMDELTPQTVLENGYYALSKTEIAVCVPVMSGGYFYKPRPLDIILFLHVYIFFL